MPPGGAGPGVPAVPDGEPAPARPLRRAEGDAGGHWHGAGAWGGLQPLRGGEVFIPAGRGLPREAVRGVRRALPGGIGPGVRDKALYGRGLAGACPPAAGGTGGALRRPAGAHPLLGRGGGPGPGIGLPPGPGGGSVGRGGGKALQGLERIKAPGRADLF